MKAPAYVRVFYFVDGAHFRRRCTLCHSGFWKIEPDYWWKIESTFHEAITEPGARAHFDQQHAKAKPDCHERLRIAGL